MDGNTLVTWEEFSNLKIRKYRKLYTDIENLHVYVNFCIHETALQIAQFNKNYEILLDLYKRGRELGITNSQLFEFGNNIRWAKQKRHGAYLKSPILDKRDNKDLRVGTGGSNKNKVRYPSKKRSIKTWKKFYKLFPELAEKDQFDGKSSLKMK